MHIRFKDVLDNALGAEREGSRNGNISEKKWMKKSLCKIVLLVFAGVMLLGIGMMVAGHYQVFSFRVLVEMLVSQLANGSFNSYINLAVYSVGTLHVLTLYSYYQYSHSPVVL